MSFTSSTCRFQPIRRSGSVPCLTRNRKKTADNTQRPRTPSISIVAPKLKPFIPPSPAPNPLAGLNLSQTPAELRHSLTCLSDHLGISNPTTTPRDDLFKKMELECQPLRQQFLSGGRGRKTAVVLPFSVIPPPTAKQEPEKSKHSPPIDKEIHIVSRIPRSRSSSSINLNSRGMVRSSSLSTLITRPTGIPVKDTASSNKIGRLHSPAPVKTMSVSTSSSINVPNMRKISAPLVTGRSSLIKSRTAGPLVCRSISEGAPPHVKYSSNI